MSATDLYNILGKLPHRIPRSYKEVVRLEKPIQDIFMAAMKDQVDSLVQKDTWRLVPKAKDMKVLPGKWVFDYKLQPNADLDRVRARWVVCGNFQEVSNTNVFAAVAHLASLRLFLLTVAVLDLECHQIDIKTAFLNAMKTGEKVYVKQPQAPRSHPVGYAEITDSQGVQNRFTNFIYGNFTGKSAFFN